MSYEPEIPPCGLGSASLILLRIREAVAEIQCDDERDALASALGISREMLASWGMESASRQAPFRGEEPIERWTAHSSLHGIGEYQIRFAEYFESIEHRLAVSECWKKAEPFRRILSSEDFLPLLIEVAVLQDQRIHFGTPKFVSAMTSYADMLDENSRISGPLLSCWQTAVDDWLSVSLNPAPFDFVPNPLSYKNAYFYHQFPSGGHSADNHADLSEQLRRIHQSFASGILPIAVDAFASKCMQRRDYSFTALAASSHAEGSILAISQEFLERVDKKLKSRADAAGAATLARQALMIVVPFFRQIEFTAPAFSELIDFDTSPGGCLFALFLPSTKTDLNRRIRRAAVRCSWLLHQAALAEGDTKASNIRKVASVQQRFLRELDHAVMGPADRGMQAFRDVCQLASALSNRPQQSYNESCAETLASADLAQFWQSLDSAKMKLNRAFAQLRAGYILVHFHSDLGEDIESARRFYVDGQSAATANALHEAIDALQDGSAGESKIEIKVSGVPETIPLTAPGIYEAWFLVFYQALRNAVQAAAVSSKNSVLVEVDADPEKTRCTIRIRNSMNSPLDPFRRRQIEDVVWRKHPCMDADPQKPSSRGLGLASIATMLRILNVGVDFQATEDQFSLIIGDFQYE